MTLPTLTNRIAFIIAAVAMSACSNLATSSETEVQNSEEVAASTAPEIPKESLTGESFFQILLGEIATNRRELGAAAALYSEVGRNHNDVEAINRAVILNQSVGDYDSMYPLTAKWLELRAEDPTALQAHSLSSVATGRIDEGTAAIDVLLQNDPAADVTLVLSAVERLDPQQRDELLTKLSDLESRHPDSASLLYTQARLTAIDSNPEAALSLAEASSNVEENLETSLFRFQLLLSLERIDDAEALIENLDERYPEDTQVAQQYASFLFQHRPENLEKLSELHTRFAGEPIIARTYARAAFDQEEYDNAEAVYVRLLNTRFRDEAYYFLGRIKIANSQLDAAAEHFEAISTPPYLISGLAEWANMARVEDEQRLLTALERAALVQPDQDSLLRRLEASYYQLTDRMETAEDVLSEAIAVYPTDTALLYDKAMLAANMDRMSEMENQLQRILDIDPDNINALNALGYTWADSNRNLDLANEYIDRALAAEPDNPAFQDSKGWVLYRQGDSEQALMWLEKAYETMENDEIAAHIAEVLWSLNRREEAQVYFDEVKRLNPDSKYIDGLNRIFSQ